MVYLRIAGAKGEAAVDESGGVGFASGVKFIDDGIEIWRGRAMADPDYGEDLAIGLEIFPGTRWSSAEYEFESEATGVPWLMRERRFLVLRVEGADCRLRNRLLPEKHRLVLPK